MFAVAAGWIGNPRQTPRAYVPTAPSAPALAGDEEDCAAEGEGNCATGPWPRPATPYGSRGVLDAPREKPSTASVAPGSRGLLAAARAAKLVGLSSLRNFKRVPDDCTGVVLWAYAPFTQGLGGGVRDLYSAAQAQGAVKRDNPRPGDLVFFRETYDRNRDGVRNDGWTHVGVVASVAADGTVTFVHRGKKGVSRSRMNLSAPAEHRNARGQVLNDFLRPRSSKSRAYLTGELFGAFASAESM